MASQCFPDFIKLWIDEHRGRYVQKESIRAFKKDLGTLGGAGVFAQGVYPSIKFVYVDF